MTKTELNRNMSVFPMSSIMKLTNLSARQIRYYEQHGLIFPERTKGNSRLFSLNDIDVLQEIKEMISLGYTIKEIKQKFEQKKVQQKQLSEEKIRIALYQDLMNESRFNRR